MPKLIETEFLLLDLQTTGMRPSSGHILEIAWAKASASTREPNIQSRLIQLPPGAFVSRRITALTGIKPEDMEEAVSAEEVMDLVAGDLSPFCLIHYAQFEKPFLENLYNTPQFEIFCTHQIARRLVPNLPTRGMRGLAGYFGRPLQDELKRASANVHGTFVIWQGLVEALAGQGVEQMEDLQNWLKQPFRAPRKAYEYPIDRIKRLELPDAPGVYRMVAKNGTILYVGKATSLKARVNSYFRGQKGRDRQKLEMLTQVWDLDVSVCATPLEAALLETDEIKRLNPPYNISLKKRRRRLVFYNREFSSFSFQQSPEHPLGPYASLEVLAPLSLLAEGLKNRQLRPEMFYDPLPLDLIHSGFAVYRERFGWKEDVVLSVRELLAFGLRRLRQLHSSPVNPDDEADEEESAEEGPEALTPEDVADKLDRLIVRAARAHSKSMRLTHLLNSDIGFFDGAHHRTLSFRQGQLGVTGPVEKGALRWAQLDVETYDRMRVLQTELARVRKLSPHSVQISHNC